MNVLLIGNCILEELSKILKGKGYNSHFTYIGNPVSLLYSEKIPEGLSETLRHLKIEDRLEKRTLAMQFEGISKKNHYDVIFLNYYHEQRPLLRHKKNKYFLHLNFTAIKAFEPPEAAKWISDNFDIIDTEPEKYLQRFTGLVNRARENFPSSAIVIINKFHPIEAFGPVPFWYCTEGRPFDAAYLDRMRQRINSVTEKDPSIFLFHTENIVIDFLKPGKINFQFIFPEICPLDSNKCTPDNYLRDLEHPSEFFYQKLAQYAEMIIACHESGDRDQLRSICVLKDSIFWEQLKEKSFSIDPIDLPDLYDLMKEQKDVCQKVGMENTIFFDKNDVSEIDRLFIQNLEQSRHFLQLKNVFRTVFRINPRESLIPALEMYLDYFRRLQDRNQGKRYYEISIREFASMLGSYANGFRGASY